MSKIFTFQVEKEGANPISRLHKKLDEEIEVVKVN